MNEKMLDMFLAKNKLPKNYVTALNRFMGFCDTEETKLEETARQYLKQFKEPSTYNIQLYAIKKYYQWIQLNPLTAMGTLIIDDIESILNIKPRYVVPKPKEYLTLNEVKQLLELSKSTGEHCLIIWLLWSGCHRKELFDPYLRRYNVDYEIYKLKLKTTYNQGPRTIYFEPVKDSLRNWIRIRNSITEDSWANIIKLYNKYLKNKRINMSIFRNTWLQLNRVNNEDAVLLKLGGWKIECDVTEEDTKHFYLEKHFLLEILNGN